MSWLIELLSEIWQAITGAGKKSKAMEINKPEAADKVRKL